jgi:hypothetical protein
MDNAFGPDERSGILVVAVDEAFDVHHQLGDAVRAVVTLACMQDASAEQSEAGTAKHRGGQDRS